MSFELDGDPASSNELVELEFTARRLIATEPWYVCRNYGYVSDTESAKVLFSMSESLSEVAAPADVSMTFARHDFGSPVLEVAFDEKDALSTFFVPETPDASFEAISVIQALLQTPDLDALEKAILRKTQDQLFAVAHDLEQQVSLEVTPNEPSQKSVASYLRALIMERALAVTAVRSQEYAVDEGGRLQLTEQDFISKNLDLADVTVIPNLAISYNDVVLRTGYYFESRSNREVHLQAVAYDDIDNIEEPDDVVAAFMSELYSTIPSSKNVKVLITAINSLLAARFS